MKQIQYPCTNCRRTEDPGQCDNKDCRQWRAWFLQSWEQLRRRYLPEEDPCQLCSCPAQMCVVPCSQKLEWQKKQEEAK